MKYIADRDPSVICENKSQSHKLLKLTRIQSCQSYQHSFQYISPIYLTNNLTNISHQYISPIYLINISHQYISPIILPIYLTNISHQYTSSIYLTNISHQYTSSIYLTNISHQYILPIYLKNISYQYAKSLNPLISLLCGVLFERIIYGQHIRLSTIC